LPTIRNYDVDSFASAKKTFKGLCRGV
jgi:hypothetical protein